MISLLIAEDEIMVRNLLVHYVPWQTIGVDKVYEANNGADALELASRVGPDIILSDIRMPKLRGIEFASKYHEIDPLCKIIFLSAYTDKEYYRSAIDLRVVGYIEKPVKPNEVLKTVSIAVQEITEERARKAVAKIINDSTPPLTIHKKIEGANTSAKLVQKAIRYIHENYHNENLSLAQIASSMYLSQNYLSNLFKKETGFTITQLITDIRIKTATELLENSNLSLSKIAKKTGYSEAGYFSKVFKAKTGMTPREYRRRL